MSRQKRLNAVATTALVAAFPVFPLFADEPTPTQNDAASQSAAPQVAAPQVAASETATADETLAPPDVNAAFADFNVSLFEIPDGETVEFYRQRADEIEREWNRLASSYAAQQREFARQSNPNQAFNQATLITNAPFGTVYDGKRFVAAPDDSVPARRAVALADLCGRLADAPELPREVRGQYYRKWVNVLSGRLADKSPQECREFYAKLLADEKAKSPLDLGRVFFLNGAASFYPQDDVESSQSVEATDVEKLLDIPEGESAEFYQKRSDDLNRAYLKRTIADRGNGVAPDQDLYSRVTQAFDELRKLRSQALNAEAAAFDRASVKPLFDVPSRESAAFYLERRQETENVRKQVSRLSQCQEGRDLGAFEVRLRTETLPEIDKRLAYADDLEPFDRFLRLQAWLHFADAEAIRDALDAEIARDATSEIDACRELYVRQALAKKLLADALAEARKTLPEAERSALFGLSPNPPVEPEAQAMFDAAFIEIAELADGGAVPWSLGLSWAEWAEDLALDLQNKKYGKLATQLRKEIRDALTDSENETDRRVLRKLERQIRAGEIIGSEIPVEGRNLDGTPFDWASYRGAPVLLVSGSVEQYWAPNSDPNFIPNCVEEGLKVVKYCPDLKSAEAQEKHHAQNRAAVLRFQATSGYLEQQWPGVESRMPFAAFIVPAEGKGGVNDWPYDRGILGRAFGVLFDADGRVLAVERAPLECENAPKIADELRALFPKVPVAERN